MCDIIDFNSLYYVEENEIELFLYDYDRWLRIKDGIDNVNDNDENN